MRLQFVTILIIASLSGVLSGQGWADETEISLDKLPAPVTAAVKKLFPKADLSKAVQIESEGKIEYQVTVKDQGKRIKITATAAGDIEKYKKEIDLKELPEAVTAAIEKKYSKSELKSAVSVYELEDGKEKLKRYEVKIKPTDGKNTEVRVKPDGKIKEEADSSKETPPASKS